MAEKQDGKWRSEVTEVIPAPIDKVWPILTDFDGLHRLFPQIYSSCETVEGEKNKPGALRHLTAPTPHGIVEAKERLISIDDVNHTTTYTIEWITMGWTGYLGAIDAKSTEKGETLVVWKFELDPVAGQTEEQVLPTQQGLFNAMLTLTKGLATE
ncbi:unnamed protein product [Calypogeia fissa]